LAVFSRLTRPAALTTVTLCALAVLTACGDEPGTKTAAGFDAVEISGAVGDLPEIDWKARLKSGKAETEVVEEGDGPVLEEDDDVLLNLAVSNDVAQDIGYETYGEELAAAVITVGADAEPTQVVDLLTQLIAEEIVPGETTVGTRIAAVIDVAEEWEPNIGLALTPLRIGNEDGIVVVADLEATPLEGPDGVKQAAPRWAPSLVSTDGEPTALTSDGLAKPDVKGKEIRSAVVIEGTGPAVEEGDLAVVNYLGQTWGGDEPFDGSYTKKREPLKVNVGEAQGPGINVIEGWSDGLIGVPVGSRVLIEIPPAKGYGKKGQEPSIKGDDILYFVVDILAAA
jgi:peptidylprolyl isomerase